MITVKVAQKMDDAFLELLTAVYNYTLEFVDVNFTSLALSFRTFGAFVCI